MRNAAFRGLLRPVKTYGKRGFVSDWPRRFALRSWLLLLGAVGCGRTCSSAAHTSAAHTSDASASLVEEATPVQVAAVDASMRDAAIGPEAWARYWAAMKRGRNGTVQKRYAEAIAAFSDALREVPRDARAMSERGYAKYLSGDNAGAHDDFEAAVDMVPASDAKLAAMVYFNEGLVAEQAGVGSLAASYYRQSYELNPTDAAKSKMSVCPVMVDRLPTRIYPDWQAALASISSYVGFDGWDDDYGFDHNDSSINILAVRENGAECGYAVVPFTNGFAVVHSHEDMGMGPKGRSALLSAQRVGSEWVITGQPYVPGESVCAPDGACVTTANVDGGLHEVYYVDAATGAGLWHVSYDTTFVKLIDLSVEGGELHITGAECDLRKSR